MMTAVVNVVATIVIEGLFIYWCQIFADVVEFFTKAITSTGTKKGELFFGDVSTQVKNNNVIADIKVDTGSNCGLIQRALQQCLLSAASQGSCCLTQGGCCSFCRLTRRLLQLLPPHKAAAATAAATCFYADAASHHKAAAASHHKAAAATCFYADAASHHKAAAACFYAPAVVLVYASASMLLMLLLCSTPLLFYSRCC